jgi:2-iminobutanoate/2-iminopropanoate deaminase
LPKTVHIGPGVDATTLPLSHVVEANGFVYLTGQVGNLQGRDGPVPGGIEAETVAMLDNVGRLLGAAGLGYGDVVKCTVHLLHMAEFAAMSEVYRRYFPAEPPARATLGAASLVGDYRVEIEVVAAR